MLILAGSRGMTGAALLAGTAALRAGAGLVTVGIPESLETAVARRSIPELMRLGLPETKQMTLSVSARERIFSFMERRKINCLALGPGLSTNSQTQSLVRKVVRDCGVPVVLDADGLNSFKGRSKELLRHRAPLILTPHRGEFERLFGQIWPEKEKQRIQLAKKISKLYDVVLVVKAHRTLVAAHDKIYINRTGNAGMAKGGAGDVLTGVLSAFVAQGLEPFQAAVWAVYFHGRAGDEAAKEKSELGVIASDLIEALPKVFLKK